MNHKQKPSPSSQSSTGRKIAIGAVWVVGGGLMARIIGLLNTIILARILVPEDFGLIAIGVVIAQLFQNVFDIGVSYAVVQNRDANQKDYDALFTLSLIRGLIIFVILAIIAYCSHYFYTDPRLKMIFLAMGFIAMMQSLINPKFYEFQRDQDFSKEVLLQIIDKFLSVITSIIIAYIFRSYWAIIAGIASGTLSRLFLSYLLKPYKPRLGLKARKGLFSFAGWLTGLSFLAALNNKLDVLILGKILPAAQTGNYFVGTQLADLPSREIAVPVARALYPGLSALQGDKEKMQQTYLRSAEILAAIVLPVCIGLAFIADDFVHLVLGSKWEYIAPLMRWITPFAAIATIYSGTHGFAIAKGATYTLFMRELTMFLIRTPVFIGASIFYGLHGAIIAGGALLFVNAMLFAVVYQITSGDNGLRPLWVARRSIISLLGLCFYFFLLKPYLPGLDDLPIMIRLAIDISISAILFVTMHLTLWRLSGHPDGVEQLTMNLLRPNAPL